MTSGPSPSTRRVTHEPSMPDRGSLMTERMAELTNLIRERLLKSGRVPFAESLTQQDLQISALNGMSDEVNYVLPPAPVGLDALNPPTRASLTNAGLPADAGVVLAEYNPILFAHCLHSAVTYKLVSPSQAADVAKSGILTIGSVGYVQYLDLLQNCGREFHNNCDEYRDQLADLITSDAVKRIGEGANLLGVIPPMLEVMGPIPPGIAIRGGALDMVFIQSLAKGATVFIPGAGFNSLANLNALVQCSDFKFILNDRGPFVAPVLRRVIAVLDAPNVHFISGEMSDAAAKVERIDAVVAGNLYSSSAEELGQFCRIVNERAPAGTPLHILQTDSAAKEARSTGRTWKSCLRKEGLLIERERRAPVLSPAISPELAQSELRALSGAQLRDLLDGKIEPRKSSVKHARYIQARTPPHA